MPIGKHTAYLERPMPNNNKLLNSIDNITRFTGNTLSWLVFLMMIAMCLVVLLRYGFGIGAIALQESITYMHGLLFMGGAAYALQKGAHVRVDIFYRQFNPKRKALVNLLGTLLFLIPVCSYIAYASWDYVAFSWSIKESSVESAGLPAVFLLKSLIPLMSALLLLQAIAELLRAIAVLKEEA